MESKLYKDGDKGRKVRESKKMVASMDLDPCEMVGMGVNSCWCSGTTRKMQES